MRKIILLLLLATFLLTGCSQVKKLDITNFQICSSAVDTENNFVVKPDSPMDAAISLAILDTYSDVIPDGTLNTESHIVLAHKETNITSSKHTSHNREEAVSVYYLNLQYCENNGQLEEQKRLWGEAIIIFAVDKNDKYSVKDFLHPQYSADYDEDIQKLFAASNITDKEQYEKQLLDSCQKTAAKYIENKNAATFAQPG